MKTLYLILLMLFLSACVSSGSKNTVSLEHDDNLVCEYIAKTGSNLKKRTCMSRTLAEELERENKQDLRDAWRRGQTQAHTQ
jgi:hypothetical protein